MVSESVAGTDPPTSALEHDAAIDFDGSLSEVACSITEPWPVPFVTYTGTWIVSPNFAVASAFFSCADQPVPFALTRRR